MFEPLGQEDPLGKSGNLLQYSCLKKLRWTEEPERATVMGLQRSWTPSDAHTHMHAPCPYPASLEKFLLYFPNQQLTDQFLKCYHLVVDLLDQNLNF